YDHFGCSGKQRDKRGVSKVETRPSHGGGLFVFLDFNSPLFPFCHMMKLAYELDPCQKRR
ncbi:hypothetical protein, partial [Bacillus licheniformis]|uniref:hypothetical protein n=1 Tax=Bacillus licheniformis TaxID=1402 RepID=UPI00321376CA